MSCRELTIGTSLKGKTVKQRRKIKEMKGNDGGTLRISLIRSSADRALVELAIAKQAEEGAETTSTLTVLAGDFTDAGLDVLRFIVGAE